MLDAVRKQHLYGLTRTEQDALLTAVARCSLEELYARGDAIWCDDYAPTCESMANELRQGKPLPLVLGVATFDGREFTISQDTLIPRQESTQLIDLAMQYAPTSCRRVAEYCVGSGAVIISTALRMQMTGSDYEYADYEYIAVDICDKALAIARDNCAFHNVDIPLLQIDLTDPSVTNLAALGIFDVIICNPPYVESPWLDHSSHSDDLAYEPRLALDGGVDGLCVLTDICQTISRTLKDSGLLVLEHGSDQGSAIRALLQDLGFADIEQHLDCHDLVRFTTAIKTP